MFTINSCAIIAEYNPFHNGHLYHIEKTKNALGDIPLICIMSGNFTQRGEPAIIDKWTRAKWAIENGCDAVIELPAIYAIQSANRFAGGAVHIASGIKGVEHLSFGCECQNIDAMKKISAYKRTEEYSLDLNTALQKGDTFAKAHEIAISKLDDCKNVNSPNSILALEYMGFIENTNISPIAIQRTPNSHNDTTLSQSITSATSIRKALLEDNVELKSTMPANVYTGIKNITPICLNDFTPIVFSKIFTLKEEGLVKIHEINEGLENRIYKEAMYSKSITELIERVKTKRYLYVRLQRIMINIMLDITKDFISEIDSAELPVYARLLAINKKTTDIINTNENVPVIAKAADYKKILDPLRQRIFEKDMLATSMYSIVSNIPASADLTHQIIKHSR